MKPARESQEEGACYLALGRGREGGRRAGQPSHQSHRCPVSIGLTISTKIVRKMGKAYSANPGIEVVVDNLAYPTCAQVRPVGVVVQPGCLERRFITSIEIAFGKIMVTVASVNEHMKSLRKWRKAHSREMKVDGPPIRSMREAIECGAKKEYSHEDADEIVRLGMSVSKT